MIPNEKGEKIILESHQFGGEDSEQFSEIAESLGLLQRELLDAFATRIFSIAVREQDSKHVEAAWTAMTLATQGASMRPEIDYRQLVYDALMRAGLLLFYSCQHKHALPDTKGQGFTDLASDFRDCDFPA
ncbi:MAG: hypothetical protein ACPHK8_06405 [Thermoplasmatota archaeon]